MRYIEDIFKRMGLQQIRSFLLEGLDGYKDTSLSYGKRLENESKPMYNRLKNIYHDDQELEEAMADLAQVLTVYESVYMEIGMIAGARLLYQLLLKDDITSKENVANL